MSEFFQNGWYGRSRLFLLSLPVLWPLSWLFRALACLRRLWLERQRAQRAPLGVPVIIVGNLAVGGTGKTPLLCALAEALQAAGLRPGILSRGYGGQYRGAPLRVKPDDSAARVGDEPLLLARRTACPVVICRDRVAGAEALVAAGVEVILSDDGLQHYALPRDLEIAVVDGQRGLGNGLCLPAGPLREPPARLRSVDAVVCNGPAVAPLPVTALPMQLAPLHWHDIHSGETLPLSALPPGTTVHAVAGIGHPERFFTTLRELGYQVVPHPFPDHHAFRAEDLAFDDNLPVVMTEKDAVKCHAFGCGHRYALVVSAVLPPALLAQVLQRLGRPLTS